MKGEQIMTDTFVANLSVIGQIREALEYLGKTNIPVNANCRTVDLLSNIWDEYKKPVNTTTGTLWDECKKPVNVTTETPRAYHDFSHVVNGIHSIQAIANEFPLFLDSFMPAHQWHQLVIAYLLHDIVFKIPDPDHRNEIESAEMAATLLRKVHIPETDIEEIRKLIIATTPFVIPNTNAEKLIKDIDLQTLSNPLQFQQAEFLIRLENSDVESSKFEEGRKEFWKTYLKIHDNVVFRTPFFSRHNTAALNNIKASL